MKAKITYARLQERVAAAAGITKKEAQGLLKKMSAAVGAGLVADGKVNLAGLGRFRLKVQSARTGRNPHTGASLQIPEKNRVHFLPDAQWRRVINRNYEQMPAKPAPPQPEISSAIRIPPVAPPVIAQPAPPEPAEPQPPPPNLVSDSHVDPASTPQPVETDIKAPPVDIPVPSPANNITSYRGKKTAAAIAIVLLAAVALFFMWPQSPAPPVTSRLEPARIAVSKPSPQPETRQSVPDTEKVIVSTALATVPAAEATQAAPPATVSKAPAPVSSYLVAAGDSLWKISDDVYHYAYFWPIIFQENRTTLQHPDALIVGRQLAIPIFEGRVGQLVESDFQKLADGFLQVYQAYQRHRHPRAPYYLWVAYRLRAHWVPENDLMMGEPEDFKFIRQLKGLGLIH